MNRRLPYAPVEGWLTVALVTLMCLTLAWSIDDAVPVLGQGAWTDFLMYAALGGVAAGFIGAKARWRRWTSHLIGAMFAALVVPLLVGLVLLEEDRSLGTLYRASADAASGAFVDLVIDQQLTTVQFGHHLLIIGLLVWASSMFASYAAFGHRRPINAVLLIGLMLVIVMSVTIKGDDQLPYLVLYSLSALFLLVRFHTFDEQADWIRRRIGDPAAISGLYLRGGTIFIGVTVIGSLLLTTAASSAPLAGAWSDVGGRLIEWSRGIERFLPAGAGRAFGPAFGPTATIQGVWQPNNGPALTIEMPTDEKPRKWAAVYYDQFLVGGWGQSETTALERAANAELLAGLGDAVAPTGHRELTIRVSPAFTQDTIFAPSTPLRIDQPVTARVVGDAGYLAGMSRASSNTTYTVTSLIPVLGDEAPGGLTANRLRAAGREYPAEIEELYTALPPDAIPVDGAAAALLRQMVDAFGTNPYDLAVGIHDHLRSDAFTYDPDIRDERCESASAVECFASIKRGYCEHYASTMAVLLRAVGIPTREVQGYLPGTRDLVTGRIQIDMSQAHAWVEVYFPGYGWKDFDPTGGGVGTEPEVLPAGPVISPSPSASASASAPGDGRQSLFPNEEDPGFGLGPTTTNSSPVGPLIVVSILLATIVGALAFAAWQRGPRGPVSADGAYGSMTRLATRFGFGPRPNQTVYEYAGSLGEVLPQARPQLETVARAKVEVVYGGRVLGADRLAGLRDAQRRLRLSLLRLAFRRKRRPRR